VKYNGNIVGYLAELNDGEIAFQYDDEWLRSGFSISPFSLPLENKVYITNKTTFDGVYGVFNDSMPDGWGELLVKRMLAKKGINYDRLSPLTKLTLISGSGLGALEYEPRQAQDEKIPDYTFDELAMEAEKVLDDEKEDVDFDKVYQLGGASGGARPKVHIKDANDFWIVKFPCKADPKNAGMQEFTANALAQKCGIDVNEFRLFESKQCSGYFGAKRFDRSGDKKVHMISLAALLETTHRIPNLDYIHLFQVIKRICVNKNDLYEAYKRMCFNVLYGNKDDHGKNFSFLYDESLGGYKLSPAYDTTRLPLKPEHEMTLNGEGKPTIQNLLEVAAEIKLSMDKCKSIIEEVRKNLPTQNS